MVGQGWVLIGYDTDPAAALTEAQRRQLAGIEGFTVQVCAPGGAAEVVDAEGTFKAWFDAIGARYALIRPDFYVALTAQDDDALRDRFDEVVKGLHLEPSSRMAA